MKKVGLLIVNYNDSKNAIELINSVNKYKVINKIVVVDNKSTDNSLKELEKYESHKVHIIGTSTNSGYSAAINIGSKYLIDELKDSYIIISNTDIVIDKEEDIGKLIKCFSKDISCVMPTILENDCYKKGWKLTSPNTDLIINIPIISRLYKTKLKFYNKEYFCSEISRVDVIYGCFFIIDSKALENINYMDEKVFLYYEEYILASKLKKISKLSVINNNVFVKHKHNQTIGNNVSEKNKFKIYKNSQLYYEKKYNKANILQMSLFYIFYYISYILLSIKLLFK